MYKWKRHFAIFTIVVAISTISVVFADGFGPFEQTALAVPKPTPLADKPPYTNYKGLAIGMTTVEARTKLGSPKDKSDAQDYFEFSDKESAQFYYDGEHKITAITVTYSGKLDSAPAAKAIFGEDAEVKPDGGIFKMERYTKAGFWISYTKTGGDDPMIMIAMQKM